MAQPYSYTFGGFYIEFNEILHGGSMGCVSWFISMHHNDWFSHFKSDLTCRQGLHDSLNMFVEIPICYVELLHYEFGSSMCLHLCNIKYVWCWLTLKVKVMWSALHKRIPIMKRSGVKLNLDVLGVGYTLKIWCMLVCDLWETGRISVSLKRSHGAPSLLAWCGKTLLWNQIKKKETRFGWNTRYLHWGSSDYL